MEGFPPPKDFADDDGGGEKPRSPSPIPRSPSPSLLLSESDDDDEPAGLMGPPPVPGGNVVQSGGVVRSPSPSLLLSESDEEENRPTEHVVGGENAENEPM